MGLPYHALDNHLLSLFSQAWPLTYHLPPRSFFNKALRISERGYVPYLYARSTPRLTSDIEFRGFPRCNEQKTLERNGRACGSFPFSLGLTINNNSVWHPHSFPDRIQVTLTLDIGHILSCGGQDSDMIWTIWPTVSKTPFIDYRVLKTCTKAIIFCQILANFGIYRSHCLVYINQTCPTLPTFSTKSIGFSAIYSINKNFIASSMAQSGSTYGILENGELAPKPHSRAGIAFSRHLSSPGYLNCSTQTWTISDPLDL